MQVHTHTISTLQSLYNRENITGWIFMLFLLSKSQSWEWVEWIKHKAAAISANHGLKGSLKSQSEVFNAKMSRCKQQRARVCELTNEPHSVSPQTSQPLSSLQSHSIQPNLSSTWTNMQLVIIFNPLSGWSVQEKAWWWRDESQSFVNLRQSTGDKVVDIPTESISISFHPYVVVSPDSAVHYVKG